MLSCLMTEVKKEEVRRRNQTGSFSHRRNPIICFWCGGEMGGLRGKSLVIKKLFVIQTIF